MTSPAHTDDPAPGADPLPEPARASLAHSLEAVLFSADRPVPFDELVKVLHARPAELDSAIASLTETLADRGVRLQRNGDDIQMVTAPEAAAAIERFFGLDGEARLSGAALETLAIVAYHQPVTRAQIEAIRGVNADYAVSLLEARGLIYESGRLASAGRPVLWSTTMEFLQYLGLASLDDLPHPEIRHPAQADMFAALDSPDGATEPAPDDATP